MGHSEHDACLQKSGWLDNSATDASRGHLLFAVVGFSYIFALDALLQPVDYWRLLFPTFNAEFQISWVYTGSCVATLVGLLWLATAAPRLERRIVRGFTVLLVCMTMLPLSHFVLGTTMQHLVMVLASAAALGVAIATTDSSMFALASLYPTSGAVEHVQLGIGLSLLVSALYRDSSKAIFESDKVVPATMLYFGIALATIGLGFVAFLQLVQLPRTQQCLNDQVSHPAMAGTAVWRKIWRHEAIVALTYMTTYSVYPGVITSIPCYNDYQDGWLTSTGWWPLVLMTCYAVSEPLGRFCVRWRLGFTYETVWMLAVPRLVLVLLVGCSAKGIWFPHDAFSVVLVLTLGFTNGYVGTLALVVVNDVVDVHERAFTGMCATLTINTGIFAGSTLGLIAAKVLDF
ncbi:hypothetical protein H310_02068 [Aphanomyces invadans]|uniref:Major facilitator superfamily (MFS) profile domain-containing protein n=1 Tax=Aphanomyces invadans TaxID=157072 RepID=A0A024UMA0_9STRA|nr:hypothetical protein H310_02068 [Aphanomyces invadans]ETW07586.1 hypothetical protein H310_02068 [Aphanomyces invadans]|eukprot:XP_008863679.1 hypothetical protein H310_02068 [Aphanomyces invadans]